MTPTKGAARPTLPVIFRNEGTAKKPEIVAVFPTEPGTNDPYDFTVYAHLGQHSTGTWPWYAKTKKATPDQYADLLAELRSIYEREDRDPVTLVVAQRFTKFHHQERRAALRSMRTPG